MSSIKQTMSLPYSAKQNGASSFVSNQTIGYEGELIQVAQKFISSLSEKARKSFNGRLERGLEIAKAGCVERTSSPDSTRCYRVHSLDGNNSYDVNLELRQCSCPDSRQGFACKHRVAAYYYEQVETKLAKPAPMTAGLHKAAPEMPISHKEPALGTKPHGLSRTDQILSELGFAPETPQGETTSQKLGTLNRRYLRGHDLAGTEYKVKIVNVTKERVIPHPTQPPIEKWCLWVDGLPPDMGNGILFGTRGEEDLIAIFGKVELDYLNGKSVVIYPKAMTVAGQPKISIRFRGAQ